MTFVDVFGVFSLIVVAIQILRIVIPWLYENFIGPLLLGSRIKLKDMGEWAVITGATEGIGKAYAKALAKSGLKVVLISRSLSKLEGIARDIETQFKVETRVIDVDFTSGSEIYDKIEKLLFGLEIGILVNNVGISYSNPEYFLAIPDRDKLISDIISCNILSVTNMCKIVLPGMVERKRGVIINMSSMAATIPNPLLTVYAASKAFVDKFSEDLQTEYKKQNIIIQSVLPGFVATNMSKIRKPTWMAPSADKYVASALRTLGIASHTTGYYPHALMKLVINFFTVLVPGTANGIILGTMQNIRSRALRKTATVQVKMDATE